MEVGVQNDFNKRDMRMNRMFVDIISVSALGYFSGCFLSLLFKKKLQIRMMGTGCGLGYSLNFHLKH